ncbi:MAG: hypothetical protein WA324_12355 [Bryobacteraceae bacterium]
MKTAIIFLIGFGLAGASDPQSTTGSDSSYSRVVRSKQSKVRKKPGPAREAANGGGDLARGVGKGAGDLVTLHPIRGAGALGKGAGEGTYKISKGAVGGVVKIFHHPRQEQDR